MHFVQLTDARASEATAQIYVNVGAALVFQRVANVDPPHTRIYFRLPPLTERDKGVPEGVLWVTQTPEEILKLAAEEDPPL